MFEIRVMLENNWKFFHLRPFSQAADALSDDRSHRECSKSSDLANLESRTTWYGERKRGKCGPTAYDTQKGRKEVRIDVLYGEFDLSDVQWQRWLDRGATEILIEKMELLLEETLAIEHTAFKPSTRKKHKTMGRFRTVIWKTSLNENCELQL